jgi:hypothetical protein
MSVSTTGRRLALLALLLAAVPATAADRLDELVSADEAKAMGLAKLDPAERAALAAWLERRLDGGPLPVAAPAATTAAVVAVPEAAAPVAAPAAVAPALERKPTARAELGTTAAFGLEQSDVEGEVKELRARIVGAFTGWEGKTLFKLDNGQVWRQSVTGTYRYKATDPEVVIERSLLGYKLRVVDTKRSIAVRRVK